VEKPDFRRDSESEMALVLICIAGVAGLCAALLALWSGAGFLVAVVVYLVCGAVGTLLAGIFVWRRALRRAAGLTPQSGWGLPAP
jgi:Flp pilus assembly protein TadB